MSAKKPTIATNRLRLPWVSSAADHRGSPKVRFSSLAPFPAAQWVRVARIQRTSHRFGHLQPARPAPPAHPFASRSRTRSIPPALRKQPPSQFVSPTTPPTSRSRRDTCDLYCSLHTLFDTHRTLSSTPLLTPSSDSTVSHIRLIT
jgi:hypothetical protein